MMTKTAMSEYLEDSVEELRLMIEPEEFKAKARELLEAMRSIPQGKFYASFAESSLSSWEATFASIANILGHYSGMRKKGSVNKQYYKPALNNTITRSLLFEVHNMVRWSNLPDYYIPPAS